MARGSGTPAPRGQQSPARGRGRGGGRGRGRGRGNGGQGYQNDREIESEVHALAHTLHLSTLPGNQSPGGRGAYRGRGRGRGRGKLSFDEFAHTYQGRGGGKKRGGANTGRGLGFSAARRPEFDGPPSRRGGFTPRGSQDRPFLKPIFFVKSATTLFTNEEEIFKPEIVDIEVDDTPTADQVERAFAIAEVENEDNSSSSDSEFGDQPLPPPIKAVFFGLGSDPFQDADDEPLPVMTFPLTEDDVIAIPTISLKKVASPRLPVIESIVLPSHEGGTQTPDLSVPVEVTLDATDETAEIVHVDEAKPALDLVEVESINLHRETASIVESIPTAPNNPEDIILPESAVDDSVSSDVLTKLLAGLKPPTPAADEALASASDSLFIIDTEGDQPEAMLATANTTSTAILYDVHTLEGKDDSALGEVKHQEEAEKEIPAVNSFVIDTDGAQPTNEPPSKILFSRSDATPVLGEDDEEVVFIPPVPTPTTTYDPQARFFRSRPTTPHSNPKPTITFDDFRFTSTLTSTPHGKPKLSKKRRKVEKRERRTARRREAREAGGPLRPREGDSDLEWGSDGPPDVGDSSMTPAEDSGGDVNGGMTVDPELDLDDEAYRSLLKGLMKRTDQPFVSIDDIEDERRMREEDEDDQVRGSSGDEGGDDDADGDAAIDEEESRILGEDAEDDEIPDDLSFDEDDDDSSDDEDVDASFRTRLAKVRGLANRTPVDRSFVHPDDSDSDSDDDPGPSTWADKDEDIISGIQAILDKNVDILDGRNRRQTKQLFRAIENGEFGSDMEDLVLGEDWVVEGVRKGKKKAADHLPPALRDQWLRDRAKKAEYKKARAEARALAALDPFPSSRKSGKKKDKHGNRIYQHDRNDDRPEGPIVPIVDLVTLTRQIRVFIDELSRPTMVLPPMDKDSRRRVHVIAECFSLKSTSRGSGDRRYTTLTKTSRSGLGVNEKKLGGILRGKGADMPFFKAYDRRGGADSGKNGGGGGAPRHKDGDVVGSKAAKIGEANVGFKLLQRMGWTEGERIGVTGGLADPLIAVIKNTKLGLGAALGGR